MSPLELYFFLGFFFKKEDWSEKFFLFCGRADNMAAKRRKNKAARN